MDYSMKKRVYANMMMLVMLASQVFTSYAVHGVLTVSNTNNSGAGSLRQAILDANSDPYTPHDIVFSIGTGVQTIQPTSALPAIISSYTFIDGTTQPGWTVGNPMIVIDGSLLTPYTYDGLTLSGVSNCVIQALVINNGFNNGIMITDASIGANKNVITQCFIGTNQAGTSAAPNYNGITISGSTDFNNTNNLIGGTTSINQGNLISGNSNCGINLVTNVWNTIIQNNYVGTDITGTSAVANGTGISITGSLVPLSTEQAVATGIRSNLISGNTGNGIFVQTNAIATTVSTNLIGVDITGTTALPNNIGIACQGVVSGDPSNGAVFETTINNSNVISGNSSHGIFFTTNTVNSSIDGNFIGTDLSSTSTLSNGGHGILIQGTTNAPCTNNSCGFNTPNVIMNNVSNGILLAGDVTTPDILNPLISNSIFNNGSDGIALLNGSNSSQAAPILVNAVLNADGNSIIIAATAPSTPSATTYRLDFFINSVDNTPITEGKLFIGSIPSVPSGTTVTQFFPLATTIASNLWVSATATNLNNPGTQPGDTSPYCSNLQMETLPNNIPAFMFQ
jgi:hypothetical protein